MYLYTLELKYHFDAAHRLDDHRSLCKNLHGHSWQVLVEIKSEELRKDNMIVDFGDIKEIIDEFDHTTILADSKENKDLIAVLNKNNWRLVLLPVPELPTAENIATEIRNRIYKILNVESKVTIWESPNASITYENQDL